ncbi:MAG: polysaccharide deacetylase family protein [Phycisphaerae bacterium]|nr:polysaccharide deacetylase family protein [Phycisphaerae bacterium]
MPHGVMFHHFCDARHPAGQGAISAEQFADMIAFLGRDRILPAAEWQHRAEADTLPPDALCLTFDDNLRCQYDVALPVLRDHSLTAFWFVCTSVLDGAIEPLEVYRAFRTVHFESVETFYADFFAAADRSEFAAELAEAIERFDPGNYLAEFPFYTDADRRFRFVRDRVLGPRRYNALMDRMIAERGLDVRDLAANLWMNDDCIRRLHADGHVIGLHSHTHPTRIEDLSPEEQEREYRLNAEALTKRLGDAPTTVSHPCNSYNAETLRILRDLGVRLGFRANMAPGYTSALEYPREDHANVLKEMGV